MQNLLNVSDEIGV